MTAKDIVVGIRQRNGDLRFYHVKNAKSKTLAKYQHFRQCRQDYHRRLLGISQSNDYGGHSWSKHETITHSHKVYVIGDVHTNTIENAFSLFKRGIMGTWHHLRANPRIWKRWSSPAPWSAFQDVTVV